MEVNEQEKGGTEIEKWVEICGGEKGQWER